jgi:hypothetical protein
VDHKRWARSRRIRVGSRSYVAASFAFCLAMAHVKIKWFGGRTVRMFSIIRWLAAALAVSACAQNTNHLTTTYLDRFATPKPRLEDFTECHGFGCTRVSHASLSKAAWRRVVAVFRPPPKDPQAERQRIARAVALMQILVGEQTGTAAHQWTHKALLVLPNFGDTTQLDCIDEAVNTWTYLTLMQQDGLFRFHHVAQLANAGGLTDPDIRNTAVLQEIGGGYFAIDPSLVDAGVPPPIMPLATWLAPWPPDISVSNARVQLSQ